MSALAERLGELELYTEVTLELASGDTMVEGRASPIDYTPDEHLRMELRPFDEETNRRYEVQAHCEDGEWETPTVRTVDPTHDADWTDLGELADFSVRD